MKKISLKVIKSSLSRNEMRAVVGGCAQGRCFRTSCYFASQCEPQCYCGTDNYCAG